MKRSLYLTITLILSTPALLHASDFEQSLALGAKEDERWLKLTKTAQSKQELWDHAIRNGWWSKAIALISWGKPSKKLARNPRYLLGLSDETRFEQLKEMFQEEIDPNQLVNSQTPLEIVLNSGFREDTAKNEQKLDLVDLLIEAGGNIREESTWGKTVRGYIYDQTGSSKMYFLLRCLLAAKRNVNQTIANAIYREFPELIEDHKRDDVLLDIFNYNNSLDANIFDSIPEFDSAAQAERTHKESMKRLGYDPSNLDGNTSISS